MKNLISKIQIRIIADSEDSKIKAYATAVIADVIKLRGLKIVDGSKALFVGFPSYLRQDGQFQEIYKPETREFRKELEKQVLAKYHEEISIGVI